MNKMICITVVVNVYVIYIIVIAMVIVCLSCQLSIVACPYRMLFEGCHHCHSHRMPLPSLLCHCHHYFAIAIITLPFLWNIIVIIIKCQQCCCMPLLSFVIVFIEGPWKDAITMFILGCHYHCCSITLFNGHVWWIFDKCNTSIVSFCN